MAETPRTRSRASQTEALEDKGGEIKNCQFTVGGMDPKQQQRQQALIPFVDSGDVLDPARPVRLVVVGWSLTRLENRWCCEARYGHVESRPLFHGLRDVKSIAAILIKCLLIVQNLGRPPGMHKTLQNILNSGSSSLVVPVKLHVQSFHFVPLTNQHLTHPKSAAGQLSW